MIISVYNANQPKPIQHCFPDEKITVIVGRNPASQQHKCITVDEPTASRTHLAIKLKRNCIKIMDMGSSNGTKVNTNSIQPNSWVQIADGDSIFLGDSQQKITIAFNKKQVIDKHANDESSSSNSRSREKKNSKKFQDLCKQLKISDSSLKMLKQMTSDKKSKQEKIKFLKLMGCKNLEQNWEQIEKHLKKQNKYTNTMKKANQQLSKQFQLGRAGHQKKGLGKN